MINGKGTLLWDWLWVQADLGAEGLSEVSCVVVVVCWEEKRDQVGFRRGQRQEKGAALLEQMSSELL